MKTPPRPDLSLPGAFYPNLNRTLAIFFEGLEGFNVETNSSDGRSISEGFDLEPDGKIISVDVKSLYTNVPLKEAIDLDVKK